MNERRGRLRRWSKPILICFVLTTTLFFGAAGYAVYHGSKERTDICEEVQDLRDDLVEVVKSGRDSSIEIAMDFPPKQRKTIIKNARTSYDEARSKIEPSSCP